MNALAIVAQAEGTTGGQLFQFAQYGVLGLIVIGFIFGWIVPKPTHDAVRADLAKREAQLDSLISTYEKEVIPVLTEVNRGLGALLAPAPPPPPARRTRTT